MRRRRARIPEKRSSDKQGNAIRNGSRRDTTAAENPPLPKLESPTTQEWGEQGGEGEPIDRRPRKSGKQNTDALAPLPTDEEITEERWSAAEVERSGSGWIVVALSVIGVGVIGLVGWQIWQRAGDAPQPVVTMMEPESIVPLGIEGASEDQKENIAHTLEKMQRAVDMFFGAESAEELAPFVRYPHLMMPYIKRYFAEHDVPRINDVRIMNFDTQSRGRHAFWGIVVQLDGERLVNLVAQQGLGGEMRIDWGFFVGFDGNDLGRLLADRPTGLHRVRLSLNPNSLTIYEYRDDAKWMSFSGRGIRGEVYANVYAERDTPVGLTIRQFQQISRAKDVLVTALVSFPESRVKDAVVIEELIQTGWIDLQEPLPVKGEVPTAVEDAVFLPPISG